MITFKRNEIIAFPKALAGCSPEACKVYITSCSLPGEDHTFDSIKEVSGLGRNVVRRALRELEERGFASLDTFRDESGNYKGRGWKVESVEIESVDTNAPAPTSSLMEYPSTDGYMIKYRTEDELEYKDAAWKIVSKSKEYRRLLKELDVSRDVFLDQFLSYALERDVPLQKRRLEGLMKKHDEIMKEQAKTVTGKVRQTDRSEYEEMKTRVWEISSQYIKNYKKVGGREDNKEMEREAIGMIYHRTNFTRKDFSALILAVNFGWVWDPVLKPFLWSRYVDDGAFLYHDFMEMAREMVFSFRELAHAPDSNYIWDDYTNEQGLKARNIARNYWGRNKEVFESLYKRLKV